MLGLKLNHVSKRGHMSLAHSMTSHFTMAYILCYCGLTTCLLLFRPLCGNLVWNDSGLVSLTLWKTNFSSFYVSTYILTPHNMILLYFLCLISMSQVVLYCLLVLPLWIDVVFTLSTLLYPLSYCIWCRNIPWQLVDHIKSGRLMMTHYSKLSAAIASLKCI